MSAMVNPSFGEFQAMQDFVLWFIEVFPDVLMTYPFVAFTGLAFLSWTVGLFARMIRLR